MKKIILFLAIIVTLATAGFFIYKNYTADKEKESAPVKDQSPGQGGIMQFTTPSE